MVDHSKWYADPDQLIDIVRDTRTHWGHLPEIRGYDRLVELRRGGQGVVYKARQQSTGRTVAIKVLLDGVFASDRSRRRFQRETELVARLRHPNIVRIYDSGVTADHHLYYVMEFIEGTAINEGDLGGADGLQETLRVFLCICEAVQHAHQRGIIHRDLKPSNILIDENGAPQILDFGLAKITAAETPRARAETSVSQSGQILGSLPWASPEQLEGGLDNVDIRSDVYSLGVILYQLLTGQLPHPIAGSLRRVLDGITTERPPPPRAVNRQIPDDVETIVLRCLAKEPGRRYQTVGELAAEIRRYLSGEPIDARRDNRWYVLRKTLARHKAVTALAAALLVLLVGFAVTMTFLYERAVTAERSTQREAATVQALNEFLLTMLETADPDHAPSRDVSLREVLRLASARIQTDDTLSPEVASEIHRTIGRTFLQLGDYDDAETHLRASLELRTQIFGEHSAMAAAGMRNFAEVLIKTRKLDEAQRWLQTALSYYRATDGPGSDAQFNSAVAACLTSLGQVHHLRGELQEAETRFREALPLMPDGSEQQRDRVSITLALAGVLRDQGRLPESEELFGEALESARQVHGPRHPEVAAILNNLGQLYIQQEELDRADAAYRASLAIYRETLDPDHPRLATTLSNVGQLAGIRGDYATAEEMFREALDIYRDRLGPDHEFVATIIHNIASCKLNGHDYSGAIPEFQAALDIYHRAYGQDHPNNAIILYSLARAHEGNGDLAEAEIVLREALTIQTRALPEAHPDTANTLGMLGRIIMVQGSPDEAEPMLRRSLDMLRSTLPAGHTWSAIAETRLGACLTRLGQFEEAQQLLEPGVQTLEGTLGANDRRAREARAALCDLYRASGQSDLLDACRATLESHDQAP